MAGAIAIGVEMFQAKLFSHFVDSKVKLTVAVSVLFFVFVSGGDDSDHFSLIISFGTAEGLCAT